MTTPGATLDDLLAAAGRSLADAQGGIAGSQAVATNMAISQVDLEVKATFDQDEDGALRLRTVSADSARGVPAWGVSTITARFVAVSAEPSVPASPVRSASDVAAEVRRRPDVRRLEKILGRLNVDPVFVPDTRRWMVTVTDPSGRVVRELVIADESSSRRG